eukprot:CAMPEP_0172693928 /NCGR_PEP_ID=MMETSP1074-20121228/26349_1 /TAXON_ID=2916 /ORGANISM="Ceratium fusus, Strain PA161109" /LENGTH=76 /DNA_ID=CAMNT_0013514381 /DNA_START=164 /DNA_END=391 /DNA_ORIENTATION=+
MLRRMCHVAGLQTHWPTGGATTFELMIISARAAIGAGRLRKLHCFAPLASPLMGVEGYGAGMKREEVKSGWAHGNR